MLIAPAVIFLACFLISAVGPRPERPDVQIAAKEMLDKMSHPLQDEALVLPAAGEDCPLVRKTNGA